MSKVCRIVIVSLLVTLISSVSASENIQVKSKVDLFDIGLAKINNDAYYDLYTVNHNFAETFILNEQGGFNKTADEYNQLMTSGFPELESTGSSPQVEKGLYVFSPKRKVIILVCKECSQEAKGTLKIPYPQSLEKGVKVLHQQHGEVNIAENSEGNQYLDVKFNLSKNGIIVLESIYFSVKTVVNVDMEASEIHVGPNGEIAKSSEFIFQHHDNHGFAWAKVNGDNLTDLFVTVGGLRANLKYFDSDYISKDMLVINDAGNLKNVYEESGLSKTDCRSYKSEWVDVDLDNDLDLYVGCKNGQNKLYKQTGVGSGRFEDVAQDLGLNIFHGDEFKWQDWNGDGYPDLLILQKNKLNLFINESFKSFNLLKKSKNLGDKLDSVNTSIKVLDFNNNGKLDVFVTTMDSLFVFKQNNKGSFSQVDTNALGMPSDYKGHLNFVDINNDGKTDVCLFEHGIYLQRKNGKIHLSKKLASRFKNKKYHKKFKSFLWFDADNNGQWDVIEASSNMRDVEKKKVHSKKIFDYQYSDMKQWDSVLLHKNIKSSNNWLQVDLIGPEFNRDAIGAKIIVAFDGIEQTKYNHGTGDVFHSQGHYRQYFGMGSSEKADITVVWPDKTTVHLKGVTVNQLLTINQKVEEIKLQVKQKES